MGSVATLCSGIHSVARTVRLLACRPWLSLYYIVGVVDDGVGKESERTSYQ